jgi:hypothetical protein
MTLDQRRPSQSASPPTTNTRQADEVEIRIAVATVRQQPELD